MKPVKDEQSSWMTAITFAEAGEWQTALELIGVGGSGRMNRMVEKHFTAAAFAEAGLHEEALEILDGRMKPGKDINDFLVAIGLHDVRVTYAVLSTKGA